MQLRCERQGKLWPLGRFIRGWRRCAPTSCAVKHANMTHWRVSRRNSSGQISKGMLGGKKWIRTFIRRILVQLLSMGMALTMLCCSQSCNHWWRVDWFKYRQTLDKKIWRWSADFWQFSKTLTVNQQKKVTMQRVNLLFTHFKNKSINHYLPFGNKVIVY